jgi:hypothetical protein
MFRSYDHHQAENILLARVTQVTTDPLKVSVLPKLSRNVWSGSGFPCNATLVWIFYSVTATCFGLMTFFRRKFPLEDGHKTETCSGYWIKYSNQCCVRRKPWSWPSTRNRMQTTNFTKCVSEHKQHPDQPSNWTPPEHKSKVQLFRQISSVHILIIFSLIKQTRTLIK